MGADSDTKAPKVAPTSCGQIFLTYKKAFFILQSQKRKFLSIINSSGSKRVSIAWALVNNPSLVIADEPTANLDSETVRMVIEIMRELNERDEITFIFSTHDQRLLDKVKRLVRLEDGKIIQEK